MQVIIDRIENEQVVLELPDKNHAVCDKKIFPQNIKDGDILDITININNSERLKKEEEIKKLQEKLKNKK